MRDEAARREFTRLYRDHSIAIKRYTLRQLSDARSCEDVVSETFLVAWRRWDDLPSSNRELPWLYSIAFHLLSNQRRSRDRRYRLQARLSLERDSSEDDESSGFDISGVQRALARLRPSDREMLEFVYWEKLTYREIALVVGISENAVGIRINRAKTAMSVLLSLPSNDFPNQSVAEEFEI